MSGTRTATRRFPDCCAPALTALRPRDPECDKHRRRGTRGTRGAAWAGAQWARRPELRTGFASCRFKSNGVTALRTNSLRRPEVHFSTILQVCWVKSRWAFSHCAGPPAHCAPQYWLWHLSWNASSVSLLIQAEDELTPARAWLTRRVDQVHRPKKFSDTFIERRCWGAFPELYSKAHLFNRP